MRPIFFAHTVFILGCAVGDCGVLLGADKPPVLIQETDPNEGISKAGIIFDSADVELTADQVGVPSSLKSSIGLPESIANALESWRYSPYKKNGASVPFSIKIRFPIARKITPVTERHLDRAKLLTWFVQHDPKCAILGSPFALADTESAAKLTDPWLEAVKQHPDDSDAILHALNFPQVANAPKAMEILAAHYSKRNETAEWAGEIYGLAALGMTALDPVSGKAIAASDASASTAFAAQAREKLLTSTDSKMVLTGLVTPLTRAGRSLAANHSLPGAFDTVCAKLLAVTKAFDPETVQSCDSSLEEAVDQTDVVNFDEKVVQAKLIRKVAPMYPEEAKRLRVTGTVTFSVIVNKTGDIAELGVTSGPFLLYHSARAAVKDWKFSATQIDVKAVDISKVLRVNYVLNNW